MVQLGYVEELRVWLRQLKIEYSVFSEVEPEPTLQGVVAGAKACERFGANAIIALGGGGPLDAAKLIRLLYEHPERSLKELATAFLELRHRTSMFPDVSRKVRRLIAIPATSGTGSEVSPFATVTDQGVKYALCSYRLMPDISIVDARYTEALPKGLVADAGFVSFVQAVESAISVWASDFTMPLSMRAAWLLLRHLQASYAAGDEEAREKVHHAAAIAGMACSNAFLGVNSAMAHALVAEFHLPQGAASASVFDVVVRYNSDPAPTRMAAFPQYKFPQSLQRYSELARHAGVPEADEVTMTEGFIQKARELRAALGLPLTIRDAGVSEQDFEAKVDQLARKAFQDQCVGTNPRFPLIPELKQLFSQAFAGDQPTLHKSLAKR
mmetsp:Transcript_17835/g.56215  ORF Transcript_17835/g.56215 Transcript_17835/m.56215 type:complete len:383 (+) Transcript_17835:83-1231(+)